ncbi:MAG: L-histidine N(alpha)-methyltransferase [Gemmatimonadota bacterium]|nr:MAG: L-histidine N(alpha)-methyltransferase [Gemmatimonadota bacterium]
MPSSSIQDRSTMITTDLEIFADSFAKDVDRGLRQTPKNIPCIYFYDYQGSLLFEKICRLEEYYLTRAETEILKTFSEDIVSCLPTDLVLVELGSGSCIKTQLIIEELLNQHDKVTYSPIDISKKMLKESSISLLEQYEDLEIISIAAEYEEGLRQIDMRDERPKLILWLGSSIGNFEQQEAIRFLQNTVKTLSSQDYLLIGFDLIKERRALEQAYNDNQYVTATFNLNLLSRINRELGGEFDPNTFRHKAVYNEENSRIEMYLISTCEQDVYIADLDRSYHFKKNERIHTENSHKFSLQAIDQLADEVGMEIIKQWFDTKRYFNVTLFQPHKEKSLLK